MTKYGNFYDLFFTMSGHYFTLHFTPCKYVCIFINCITSAYLYVYFTYSIYTYLHISMTIIMMSNKQNHFIFTLFNLETNNLPDALNWWVYTCMVEIVYLDTQHNIYDKQICSIFNMNAVKIHIHIYYTIIQTCMNVYSFIHKL